MWGDDNQARLEDLLIQLSESLVVLEDEETAQGIKAELSEIYCGNWRHLYSQLFLLLMRLNKQDSEKLVNLSANLKCLLNDPSPDTEVTKSLYKLYDHVMLDIARIQSWTQQNQLLDERLAQSHLDILQVEEKADEISDTVTNLQTQYVTILGIFASIVLVVSGSISFSNSVFSNIMQATKQQVGVALCFHALVIVNVIYCLVGVLLKNLKKDFHAKDSRYITIFNALVCALLLFFLLCPSCGCR